jgi:hypothetical protein
MPSELTLLLLLVLPSELSSEQPSELTLALLSELPSELTLVQRLPQRSQRLPQRSQRLPQRCHLPGWKHH